MGKYIHIGAFGMTWVCIALFLAAISSGGALKSMGIHPYNIVLILSLISFFFGVVGFSGIDSWFAMVRSMVTVILTLGLSVMTYLIIFFGRLYSSFL